MRVRYYCHAGQETGYGRAATELALALLEAGIDLQIVPLNPSLSLPFTGKAAALQGHLVDLNADGPAPDVAIIHTMPVDAVEFAIGNGRQENECLIAYTTWEGVDAPAELVDGLFDTFNRVWVPSTTTRDALIAGGVQDGKNACQVLPHTFTPRRKRWGSASNLPVGSPDRPFSFYWIGAWSCRKNPHGLIRAFCHAFGPGDPVELVLHSPGTSKESVLAAQAATGLAQADLPRILLSNKHLDDEQIWQLHETADCFVTATRGEAWNLPAFEAMQAGRHVIVPVGHGHDDFLFAPDGSDEDYLITSADYCVAYEQPAFLDVEMLGAAGGAVGFRSIGVQGMTSRTTWLDPDLIMLGREMRSAFENRTRDITVHYDLEERFGHKTVAAQAIEYIKEALDEG